MKYFASLLASFALTLTAHAENSSTANNPVGTQTDKNTILPGRHLSEHQAVEIASKKLPANLSLQCNFKDGIWEILEVQKNVWGVSSRTTNAAGKVTIESTNATRAVMRVRDTDGKAEPIKP